MTVKHTFNNITDDTRNVLEVLRSSDIFRDGETVDAVAMGEEVDTITARLGKFNVLLCFVKLDSGTVYFPHGYHLDDLGAGKDEDHTFTNPTGTNKDRFLTLTRELVKALR